MNRTGLFALIAVAVVAAAAAFWYFAPSRGQNEASVPPETMTATDKLGEPSTTEAPAGTATGQSAPQPGSATTPPADGAAPPPSDDLTPAPAPEEEKDEAAPNAQALNDATSNGRGGLSAAPAPPPPPPPPPAPVTEPAAPPPAKADRRERAAPAPAMTAAAPPRQEDIPVFPWPVPKASATQAVPRKLIKIDRQMFKLYKAPAVGADEETPR